ncbi:hypothetical protein DM02DRAFT_690679 [Periconia macrospinosa]|uniref:G-protein coupled receptors family 2 profile 2 domain-containing protein n=1 Tax=Periconia macrospinosa TaxID=97972 RepID=A0A2V1EEQ0_9PLEO|nr:hypothetical protein DM02DRAFT_690679 [Periconia macrospinosa]
MSNETVSSSLRGLCAAPFFDVTKFGNEGFVEGRFCLAIQPGLSCCLPCPATDYLYPADFKTWYRAAEILNLVGLVLLCFLLLCFIVLPPEKSRRHYLSNCLIVAAIMIALAFVIPLGTKPQQCHDEITPNDMYSNLTCAFSGAFLIAGGMSMAVWIFIRALSMHLQICWDILPGKKFFYSAQIFGWAIAAGFFTATITVTGVSYRFGDLCHVNYQDAIKDFWGPLLVIAGSATVIQLTTFAYCMKVYIQNIWSDDTETQSMSTGLPSYTNSVHTRSARAVYRRVSKVVWLQWRGIAIVVFILVDVIFFSVVFIYLNDITTHAMDDIEKAKPFIACLMKNPVNHESCTALGEALFISKSTVIAILIMLSLAGIQVFVLLFRTTMITAWVDLFRHKGEFVSLDAKHDNHHIESQQYELNKFAVSPVSVAPNAINSPGFETEIRSQTTSPDFSNEAQRNYQTPKQSFSAPLSPTHRGDWNPQSTHARGGLGFHPPLGEEDEKQYYGDRF